MRRCSAPSSWRWPPFPAATTPAFPWCYGKVSTPAASDGVALRVDAIQCEVRDGPCLNVIAEEGIFQTDELALERRWPHFPPGPMTRPASRVDKDLTAALIAEAPDADVLLLLTDVPAVEVHHGTPQSRPITRATPAELRDRPFPAGSMGPKVGAVPLRRIDRPHGRIGTLCDIEAILDGKAGTIVAPSGWYS